MAVMSKDTRISAQISDTTRRLVDRHVRRTGVKEGHLVEQALLHHLQALDEIPAEYVVPSTDRCVSQDRRGNAALGRVGSADARAP